MSISCTQLVSAAPEAANIMSLRTSSVTVTVVTVSSLLCKMETNLKLFRTDIVLVQCL